MPCKCPEMNPVPTEPCLHCVLLPCSSGETWAVPLNSVAQVVVRGEVRSERLRWRGREVPVYAPAAAEQTSGVYAVMLGLGDVAGDYWAVSLRNHALVYLPLTEADITELAGDGSVIADALAVCAVAGASCVVPDLGALQLSLHAGPPASLGKI